MYAVVECLMRCLIVLGLNLRKLVEANPIIITRILSITRI
jgi:hypothetical protein